MAILANEARTLRLVLELVDRELPGRLPGVAAPPVEQLRVLGRAGMEFYELRDKGFWPLLRLPVLYLEGTDPPAIVQGIRDLCARRTQGFALRAGKDGEVAVQIGAETELTFVVEAGFDLSVFLRETSGRGAEPGRELALFRFVTGMADLVQFADGVQQEWTRLPPVDRGA